MFQAACDVDQFMSEEGYPACGPLHPLAGMSGSLPYSIHDAYGTYCHVLPASCLASSDGMPAFDHQGSASTAYNGSKAAPSKAADTCDVSSSAAALSSAAAARPYLTLLSQRKAQAQGQHPSNNVVSAPSALYGVHRANHLPSAHLPPAPSFTRPPAAFAAPAPSAAAPPYGAPVAHPAPPYGAAAGRAAAPLPPAAAAAVSGNLLAQKLDQLRSYQQQHQQQQSATAAAPPPAASACEGVVAPRPMSVLYGVAREGYMRLAAAHQQQQQEQLPCWPAHKPAHGTKAAASSALSEDTWHAAAASHPAAPSAAAHPSASGSWESAASAQAGCALECDEVLSGPCALLGAAAAAAPAAPALLWQRLAPQRELPRHLHEADREGCCDSDTVTDAWCWVEDDDAGGGCARTAGSRRASVDGCFGRAGSLSVQRRLLCAQASLYTDAATPRALSVANALMSTTLLPDNVQFVPVQLNSFLYQLAAQWQFPAYVVALGSSYFQRLLKTMPLLQAAAKGLPEFACYQQPTTCTCGAHWGLLSGVHAPACPCSAAADAAGAHLLGGVAATGGGASAAGFGGGGGAIPNPATTLRSIQFTCIFLACKVADQVHALGLLRYMLGALTGGASQFSLQQAAAVEARCLAGLGWRLGPWFASDELAEDDYSQLCSAMGM